MITYEKQSDGSSIVTLTPEDYERLYAPRDGEKVSRQEALTRALMRATVAAYGHADVIDGGTCNFDAPTLNYRDCGISKKAAKEAIAAAGLRCFEWRVCHDTELVIGGPCFFGQANRRTAMAEAFHAALKADGYATGMYYQMD